jgi:uncharacterized protein (DUF1015 family)
VADVRPFRAVRYARPSASVTAPPYDVIDEDGRRALAAEPHNVVNLTLEPDAGVAAARYARWLGEGVLVRDEAPAAWWIEQDYVDLAGVSRRRDGVLASLRVEPYETGAVLRHERTHAGPKEGRLRLLRATRVQLEPIFVLHDTDPGLERPRGEPDMDVAGTRLWRIDDADVSERFADAQLLIADGHHRYETAVAFAEEDGADRMPVVLVSTSDRGLEVYPTHRVFTGRPDIRVSGDVVAGLGEGLEALAREGFDHSAAVFLRDGETTLVRGAAGELDVDLVDHFGHEGLSYTADAEEAERRVRSGDADAAFVLRAPRIEDVFERARRGEPMPQKTTYFFPKLVSGLVFHPVDG